MSTLTSSGRFTLYFPVSKRLRNASQYWAVQPEIATALGNLIRYLRLCDEYSCGNFALLERAFVGHMHVFTDIDDLNAQGAELEPVKYVEGRNYPLCDFPPPEWFSEKNEKSGLAKQQLSEMLAVLCKFLFIRIESRPDDQPDFIRHYDDRFLKHLFVDEIARVIDLSFHTCLAQDVLELLPFDSSPTSLAQEMWESLSFV